MGKNRDVSLVVRPARASDADFLTDMLVVAAFWRPAGPRGSVAEVLAQPQLAHYVVGWPRRGDVGVIALHGRRRIGAAWLRMLPASDPGFGFVDDATPELAIGVTEGWRGRGVGDRLLEGLITAAADHGFTSVSLSVEQENPAKRLYERHGFRPVREESGSATMLLLMGGG